jgi:uncharacterized protein (TIGR02594 family)
MLEPAWMKYARSQIGVTEVPGAGSSEVVLSYYAKAGHPEIKDDATAWCAAFAGACLEESGYPSSKSLMARSYLTWGKKIDSPVPGDVTVLWRGSPSSSEGHVGFFVKQDATHVWLLGGNQGDKVCIEAFPKSRVLGYREPVTAANSRTVKSASLDMVQAGVAGAVLLDSESHVMGISDLVQKLGVSVPSFLVASLAISIMLRMVIIWARYDDLKTKGR